MSKTLTLIKKVCKYKKFFTTKKAPQDLRGFLILFVPCMSDYLTDIALGPALTISAGMFGYF